LRAGRQPLVRVNPPAGDSPRVCRRAQPAVYLPHDGPGPAVRRELERRQPYPAVRPVQPDQTAASGINLVAAHFFRCEHRQAQQPGSHVAIEVVEFRRAVPGLGVSRRLRVRLGRRPARLDLRPEPAQSARDPGAGIQRPGAVHGGRSHRANDRMIGRQQVKQLVAKGGPRLDRIGRGRPVDDRKQAGRLLVIGATDDVVPVLSYRANQRINRLLARHSFGQGGDVPSSETPE
jgi:hypothetical protein